MALEGTITVKAVWDDEAKVWVATSEDIHGLAVEAAGLEELHVQVYGAIRDLIELNGFASDLPEVPVCIMSEQLGRVRVNC